MAEETKRDHGNASHQAAHTSAAAIEDGSMTVAVATGIAVAVLAPELLPGMAIGVAAMLAPKFLPSLGGILRPVVKTAVRASYATAQKTKEMAAEASEQFQDLVAEARAGQDGQEAKTSGPRTTRQTARSRRA